MESIVLIIAAFVTSSISAVIGMGGGIILLGIMAILMPEGYMVIALHGMIQLFSNSTRSFVFRNHIQLNIDQKNHGLYHMNRQELFLYYSLSFLDISYEVLI
mgnify:CR=1 FL=1